MSGDPKPRPRPARAGADGPTPARPPRAEPAASRERSAVREERVCVAPDGVRWVVEVAGRARTPGRTVPGVDLVILLFRPENDDEGADSGARPAGSVPPTGTLEVVTALSSLDELADDALLALLSAARPFRPQLTERREPSPGRRRPRRG